MKNAIKNKLKCCENIRKIEKELFVVTKKQLKHGLEWIYRKTKITVSYEDCGHLDLFLYPDYPNEQKKLVLFLKVNEADGRVNVTDLMGNGHESGFQDSGYGTLIFNVAIQALYAIYEIDLGNTSTETITLSASVSSSGDPADEPYRSQCRDRRARFWSKFGFQLHDPSEFNTRMKASLSQLHLCNGGLVKNGSPRLVSLDQFWVKGYAPKVFQSDIDELLALDFYQFNLQSCPSRSDVDQALYATVSWARCIARMLPVVFGLGVFYLAFPYVDPLRGILFSFLGIFGCYVMLQFLGGKLWTALPSYRSYVELSEMRGKIISNVKDYIRDVEDKNNGLLWRLHQGLQTMDNFQKDIFNEMAEASKKQHVYMLADHHEDYREYIAIAKSVVTKDDFTIF